MVDSSHQHKTDVQNKVRNTRAGVEVTKDLAGNAVDSSVPSDTDANIDSKGRAADNLSFSKTQKGVRKI